jgi:hypothetical protein
MQREAFCIICGSQNSAEDDSSVMVYYIELIGKTLLMSQRNILPTSKGKDVFVHVMKLYWELEESLHSFRNLVRFMTWHF